MAWQVQEAKQRLSALLRAAATGQPQVITRHGEEVAVVIDIATHRRYAGVEQDRAEFLRHGPAFDELKLERSGETTPVVVVVVVVVVDLDAAHPATG